MNSLGFFKSFLRFITSFFLLSLLFFILLKTLYPDAPAIFSQAVIYGLLMALGYTFLPINHTVWQETWVYPEAHLESQFKQWFSKEPATLDEIIRMEHWQIGAVKKLPNKITIAYRLTQFWYMRAKFNLELTPDNTLEATIKISGLVKLGDFGRRLLEQQGRKLKETFENHYLKESFLYLYQ